MKPPPPISLLLATALLSPHLGPAQNIIDSTTFTDTADPIRLSATDLEQVLSNAPARIISLTSPAARQVAAELNCHVADLIAGWPWLPFHHTLGISGYESYFAHPDELVLVLALARPALEGTTLEAATNFVRRLLDTDPCYQAEFLSPTADQPRESYVVPAHLRLKPPRNARSALGVYAFWAWIHLNRDPALLDSHWSAIHHRIEPLVTNAYRFDPARQDYTQDEARKLNGDIAGLIGFTRLAEMRADRAPAEMARQKLRQLLELRLNLERVNPRIIDPTTASKQMHANRLARYCDLTPELGRALRDATQDLARRRLQACRAERNAWFLAFGDRFIGGENYTNPADFPRALFAGAALIEDLPAAELFTFLDVPWCKADLYFIEKCAYALWAESGRPFAPWNQAPLR
jgi:hypothetical protein